jgi:hypothetical protein
MGYTSPFFARLTKAFSWVTPTSSQTSAVSSLVSLHLSSQDFLSNPLFGPNLFFCMSDTLLSTSIAPGSHRPFTSPKHLFFFLAFPFNIYYPSHYPLLS